MHNFIYLNSEHMQEKHGLNLLGLNYMELFFKKTFKSI